MTARATEQDKKLKQYLEDERIALFLQNEEFMKELQRNREFLIALERGMALVNLLTYEIKSHHNVSLNLVCTTFGGAMLYTLYILVEISHRM